MSNINKQELRLTAEKAKDNFMPNFMVPTRDLLALLDELEAAERRSTELTEALRQSVIGYKSCLRMGYDRILDLGGDCDSPEVMIAGNPDIQQAEKLLAAAAGKGE
ncbi:hypothetical protein [Enterobacter hormaechei]|uniref:hypothetical protein n=1 Tax=Enterobacter hormaechei TaxID=158836 RepID=UPI00079C8B30|nr:hypothetical protein [Enterobacter hormaechei]ELC6297089.1 hypothetical protein [Enterobacter hormaechei]ELC6543338.1 hypothetical protein [Enterobacter hormaechei]CZW64949.1 Uncharacterised protein [Enterobacter hormaechei]HDT5169969.1 hypothetical protein [Enterobacter hormaechei subsp. steigerwaltii]HDT5188928.1 hypothetical protein [Enterobacter hormaechei subsp. steigerwaltii]